MDALSISGGKPLYGTVQISGAKNAVLPIMAATVLHGGKYVLHNCPDITDVGFAAQIIRALGGSAVRVGTVMTVDTRELTGHTVPASLMAKMRASVLFLGPLLARFGKAVLTVPGGCPLGRRPIDLHLEAMASMGAAVTLQEGEINCTAPCLHGCCIEFLYPSVGATENALMAAVACKGTVTLKNAAREPEITDLVRFLQTMGADIQGRGTDTLTISGGAPLHDSDHSIMPDRIETATFLCAAAGCGGRVTLHGADGADLLPVLRVLEDAGCCIEDTCGSITLTCSGRLKAVADIETAPYPGFPTDAQALVMAAMLRSEGSTRFSETVFERRFGHVSQFRRHGAEIETMSAAALVSGVETLFGAQTRACDLRAAAALILAALQAQGESTVFGLKHLHRGYDNLAGKLRSLGAGIR